MKFDPSFFQDEVRDDFLVPRRMKHFWASKLEMLEDIDKVCKKNGITWYADSGTLLGAVRHQGFIPWDDDVDIAMKREDYNHFLEIAQDELPEEYGVFTNESGSFGTDNAAYVANWNEKEECLRLTRERLIKYHGCPFMTAIDVFPLDYLSRDAQIEDLRDELLRGIWWDVQMIKDDHKEGTDKHRDEILERTATIEQILNTKLPDWHGNFQVLLNHLRLLSDNLLQIVPEDQADEFTLIRFWLIGGYPNMRLKKEWYDKVVYLPFEGYSMPGPAEYDKVLTRVYGDYMTPVRGTQSHDYPQYAGQVKRFEEWQASIGDMREIEDVVADVLGVHDIT
jgi:lipopolysaccharide cholinephosphotransferase